MVEVPVSSKMLWTVEEAAAISHIGENRIRELISADDCDFTLCVGVKKLIKADKFKDYILKLTHI